MDEGRSYSREEANAALPELRERLRRIREARQAMLAAAEVVRARVAADGGGAAGTEVLEAAKALRSEIERLAAENIVLRDAETGLIDFPSEREGRPVFLCWRLGEAEVAHWHDVDAGFLGRRPL
jgi:hypothetical protein